LRERGEDRLDITGKAEKGQQDAEKDGYHGSYQALSRRSRCGHKNDKSMDPDCSPPNLGKKIIGPHNTGTDGPRGRHKNDVLFWAQRIITEKSSTGVFQENM